MVLLVEDDASIQFLREGRILLVLADFVQFQAIILYGHKKHYILLPKAPVAVHQLEKYAALIKRRVALLPPCVEYGKYPVTLDKELHLCYQCLVLLQ